MTQQENNPVTEQHIAAREANITGRPPRLTPLDRDSARDEVMAAWKKVRGAVTGQDAEPPPGAEPPELFYYMLRYPELWDAISALSIQLQSRGVLPVRDRELVILRVGWLCQAPFEFGEHVRIGHRFGISSEEIENVTVGSAAEAWGEHERALLRAVEELHADAMITDATWETLARTYDEQQLLELTVLVGQFTLIAYHQNALRLPLYGGNRGLAAR